MKAMKNAPFHIPADSSTLWVRPKMKYRQRIANPDLSKLSRNANIGGVGAVKCYKRWIKQRRWSQRTRCIERHFPLCKAALICTEMFALVSFLFALCWFAPKCLLSFLFGQFELFGFRQHTAGWIKQRNNIHWDVFEEWYFQRDWNQQ